MVAVTIVFDLIAVVAFGAAAVVAGLNYREFDLEAGFWTNVAFGSILGAMWTAVVFAE
jgi:methyl-accepting chemotaxis protein